MGRIRHADRTAGAVIGDRTLVHRRVTRTNAAHHEFFRNLLERVGGVDAARGVPGVEEVLITAHRGQELVPLPEGSRYLGFIFARGETPELAEEALRRAHGELEIDVRGET